MNWLTHFFTGYALARLLGYKHDDFKTFYISLSCTIPDFDFLFIPFIPHGTWTHTIAFGSFLTLVYIFVFSVVLKKMPDIQFPGFRFLFMFAFLGFGIHLFQDIFTYLKSDCNTTIAHLYFYPISNASYHMNCLWQGIEYWHRIVIEYVYFIPLMGVVLYRWKKYNENPLDMLRKKNWIKNAGKSSIMPFQRRSSCFIGLKIY